MNDQLEELVLASSCCPLRVHEQYGKVKLGLNIDVMAIYWLKFSIIKGTAIML